MKVTAIANTATGKVEKDFIVKVGSNGSLISEELVEWFANQKDRTSNYITIKANGRRNVFYLPMI